MNTMVPGLTAELFTGSGSAVIGGPGPGRQFGQPAVASFPCFHAVSTSEVGYLAGLIDGGARPAVRSSTMIWRKFSGALANHLDPNCRRQP
jgi:hypothetical protein